MRKEIVFGGLFALLVVISIMQMVTVMSLSDKMESSMTGAVASSDTQATGTQSQSQAQSTQTNPSQSQSSSRSLSDLAGMVGGC